MSVFIVSITRLTTLACWEFSFNTLSDAIAFAKASENIVHPPRAAVYEIRYTDRGAQQFETDYESPVESAYQMARAGAHRDGG